MIKKAQKVLKQALTILLSFTKLYDNELDRIELNCITQHFCELLDVKSCEIKLRKTADELLVELGFFKKNLELHILTCL